MGPTYSLNKTESEPSKSFRTFSFSHLKRSPRQKAAYYEEMYSRDVAEICLLPNGMNSDEIHRRSMQFFFFFFRSISRLTVRKDNREKEYRMKRGYWTSPILLLESRLRQLFSSKLLLFFMKKETMFGRKTRTISQVLFTCFKIQPRNS